MSKSPAWAKRVADKYIGIDGSDPNAGTVPGRRAEDIHKVASFIAWQHPDTIWGRYTAEEAFQAFSRLVGIQEATLRMIVLSAQPPETE